MKFLALALIAAAGVSALHPSLEAKRASGAANVFAFPVPLLPEERNSALVELEGILNDKAILSTMTRGQRRQLVYQHHNARSEVTQLPVRRWASDHGLEFETFWIVDAVYIRNVPFALIDELASLPIIDHLEGDQVIATIPDMPEEPRVGANSSVEWNVERILAPEAWQITRGRGAVVAIIDTGVRYTHEALIGSYRGNLGGGQFNHNYNWFDPMEFQRDDFWCIPGICSPKECCYDGLIPFDPIGHGSHVAGTIAGTADFGIGVAPEASWVAAKGCRDGQCMNFGLTRSAEWVVCPWDTEGKNPNCEMGADVVSNSWGGGSGDLWYKAYVEAWTEAGIIPVSSQGNSGPRCDTAGSPGDYDDVIGVGATAVDEEDRDILADFSSRGPGKNKAGIARMKPDISAPGRSIRSASSTVGSSDDKKYSVSSGTSMSCPHVSGVIALILSANPSLDFNGVKDVLFATTNTQVGPPQNGRMGADECEGRRYDDLPSFHYGHGIVDALAAVERARSINRN